MACRVVCLAAKRNTTAYYLRRRDFAELWHTSHVYLLFLPVFGQLDCGTRLIGWHCELRGKELVTESLALAFNGEGLEGLTHQTFSAPGVG